MKRVRVVRFVEDHAGQDGVEMKGPWGRVTDYVTSKMISGRIYGPSTLPGMGGEELWATCIDGVIYEVTFQEDGDFWTARGDEDEVPERIILSRHRVEIGEPQEDVAETTRLLRHKFARERRRSQKERFDEYYPEIS